MLFCDPPDEIFSRKEAEHCGHTYGKVKDPNSHDFSALPVSTPQTCFLHRNALLERTSSRLPQPKWQGSSSVVQSSSCSYFIAVLMYSMFTYGMTSCDSSSSNSSVTFASLTGLVCPRMTALAVFFQQLLRSRPLSLKGPDHFKGASLYTSTDLQHASRFPLMLVLLQGAVGLVRFAFYCLEKALPAQVQDVLLVSELMSGPQKSRHLSSAADIRRRWR